jgi:hypothetical protein
VEIDPDELARNYPPLWVFGDGRPSKELLRAAEQSGKIKEK